MTQQEAQLNSLSQTAIGATPYGGLIGTMRNLSSAGEGIIPHKICLDKNGNQITVYNTKTNKIAGAFLKPTHEYVQKYLAEKKYGEAFLSTFGIYGQLKSVQEQEAAKCLTITPNEFLQQQARREQAAAAENARMAQEAKNKKLTFYKNPYFWLILAGIILLVIIIVTLIRYKKLNPVK